MTTTPQRPIRRDHTAPTPVPQQRPPGHDTLGVRHGRPSPRPTAPGWPGSAFDRTTHAAPQPAGRGAGPTPGGGFGVAALCLALVGLVCGLAFGLRPAGELLPAGLALLTLVLGVLALVLGVVGLGRAWHGSATNTVLTALATALAVGVGALGVWAVVVGLPATGERILPVTASGVSDRGTTPSVPGTSGVVGSTVPAIGTVPGAVGRFPGARADDVVGYRGGTVTLAGMQVTPQKLRAVPNAYGPATKCGTVTYTNVGSTEKAFGPFDWTLQSPSGVEAGPVYASGSTLLTSGTLEPGAGVTGDVCFATSAPLAGWVLLYRPAFSSAAPRAAFLG